MARAPAAAAPPTYEDEVLAVLAIEFTATDRAASDRKIKRRLREKKLGAYDANRIAAVRAFKDDVQRELHAPADSAFYARSGGPYAAFEDWRFEDLKQYFVERHPTVPEVAIAGFLPHAIYLYYLR